MLASPSPPSAPSASVWIAAAPAVFVVLWSTGFIGSRYGVPWAEPFTLTFLRMCIVVTLLTAIAWLTRAPWPRSPKIAMHIAIAGLFVHATYLSGVFYATRLGLPLGFIALIAGLQPVLTAVFSHFLLGEDLRKVQWLGMALGLAGVLVVVSSKFSFVGGSVPALVSAVIALAGITAGTLYQKRFCAQMDLRTGGVIQYVTTGITVGLLALLFETREVQWTTPLVLSLFWLALVLSIGAIGLLYLMIRRGAAARVASLFFLTPSVTALMAWLLFDETFSPVGVLGMLLTAIGVSLVMRTPRP